MLGFGKLFRDDVALEMAWASTEIDPDGPDTVILDDRKPEEEPLPELLPPSETPYA